METTSQLKKILSYVLVLLLMPISSELSAQTCPYRIEGISLWNQVSMPEMATLVKNILYPVDHATGSVKIEIPLYEIKSGTLSLPIFLSYNTGGVKVSDPSGWVGQGWMLYGIPTVTRVAQGNSDIQLTCEIDENPSNEYFKAHQVLTDNATDEEPDEYYYQLARKGGMFLYAQGSQKPSAQYLTLPYEDVRIDTLNRRFLLTDDNGDRYYFNGGTDMIIPSDNNLTNSWRASYMVSADGLDSIYFDYGNNTLNIVPNHEDRITIIDSFEDEQSRSAVHYVNEIDNGFPLDIEEQLCSPIVYTTFDNITSSWQVAPDGSLYSDNRYDSEEIRGTDIHIHSNHVTRIGFASGTVLFEVNSNYETRPLSKIVVTDNQENIIRSISFIYKAVRGRLYLERLEIGDYQRDTVEMYQFQYEQVYNLPNPGSREIDFWGYFNGFGRNANETLVPRMNIPVTTNLSDASCYHGQTLGIGSNVPRYANEEYMKYGSLKRITYPTGVTDEFVYEANRVRLNYTDDPDNSEIHFTQLLKGENGIYQVGGLRIKQIKTHYGGNSVRLRTFTYGANEDGVGRSPMFENGKYFARQFTKYYILSDIGNTFTNHARYRVYSSSPVIPMSYERGATVMYDTVTEYNGTPTENSGKTVYQYAVPEYTQYTDPVPSQQSTTKYKDWMSGHLTSKTMYRRNCVGTPSYEIIGKEEYDYQVSTKYFGDIMSNFYLLKGFSNNPQLALQRLGFEYVKIPCRFRVYAKLLTTETSVQHYGATAVTTSTAYRYDNDYEVTMTRKSTTRGNTTQTEEYVHPSQLRNTAPYNNMYSKNILTPVVETAYTRGDKYLKIITPYTEQSASQHSFFRPSSLYLQYSLSGTPEQRLSYTYDDFGHLTQIVKDDRETETYLYGYNGQYPVAKVKNATYSAVCQQLGLSFVNALLVSPVMNNSQWATLNNLRVLLPNAFVTTYYTKPLVGITSIIDPAGHTTFYDYDAFGRLSGKGIFHDSSREILERYTYHYRTEAP